ncbi:hypothetical protein WJX79_003788 [Trebouxia sp. C0005]
MLTSFPQVMNQLMSESRADSVPSWVADHQAAAPMAHLGGSGGQRHGQEDDPPYKRLRQGADSQLAAAAAAPSLHSLPNRQLPQLTSIQLLKHRARQHMANAAQTVLPQHRSALAQLSALSIDASAQIDLTGTCKPGCKQPDPAVLQPVCQTVLTVIPEDSLVYFTQHWLPNRAGSTTADEELIAAPAAEEAGDMDRVRFLRDRLVQQDRRSSCCERKRTSSGLPDQ